MRISKILILLLVSLFVYACGSSSPGSSPSDDLGSLFSPRIESKVLDFDNKIWALGGRVLDNTADSSCQGLDFSCNDVWSSEDGQDWQEVTSDIVWSIRRLFASTVFKGKIWVLGGGTGEQSCGGRKNGYCDDVWSSEDGKTWQEVTSNAAWSPRGEFGSGVFDDKIWILGGRGLDGRSQTKLRDVWNWSGIEGEAWQEVTSDTGVVFFSDLVEFDNKMWAVGQTPNYIGILSSENGKDWDILNNITNFDISANLEVFDNKIWIIHRKQIDSFTNANDIKTYPSWTSYSHPESLPSDEKSYSSVIVNDKIWVIEGHIGKNISYNIVWSWSGIAGESWVQVSDNLPE